MGNAAAAVSNHEMSPKLLQRAEEIAMDLAALWGAFCEAAGGKSGDLMDDVLTPLWNDDECSGAEYVTQLSTRSQEPEEKREPALMYALFIACAYLIDAKRAVRAGDMDLAWDHISSARDWRGITRGAWSVQQAGPKCAYDLSKLALEKRHEGGRAQKAWALKHYADNPHKYRSKNAAADAIAGMLVPKKTFNTVRNWLKHA